MKTDRLIALIMMLLEREIISARELAERLEVSRRTIYRDVDALNCAGLPIFTHHGAMGGVGLMKSFKVGKTVFTSQEIQALLSGLHGYRQLFGQRESVYAMEKLNALHSEGEHRRKQGRYVIDMALNAGNESLRKEFGYIETAMNEQCFVIFSYINSNGLTSERKVEPYQVVFKEGSWYLQAFCTEKKDYRIFKLARMSGLHVLGEKFVPRDFMSLPMNGGDWMRTDWVRVTLRLDLSVMDRVIERFGAEHIVQIEDQTCIAIYPIIPNEHGYDRLLAFGTKCEVLEPAEIREGFQEYIRHILAKYQQEKA
ncbi:transcriptional regulator [Paenibacillus oryzae]|uniref:Transcriptional regulator n=1 Tax=Paenibacillus oryzae TaxID=1844972 RepID=A0A1A5YKT3_9BACL|nr:YafY family protein [Paenibacillus oryzae]OBR66219.1 transcriptional regulator [Paenibacillus oryzae]